MNQGTGSELSTLSRQGRLWDTQPLGLFRPFLSQGCFHVATGPFMDVSNWSVDRLYELYLAIAQSDHAFRMQAMYGTASPPAGHCVFRPLSREAFTQRVLHYDSLEGGLIGRSLRQRLARQAFVYGIDSFDRAATRLAA